MTKTNKHDILHTGCGDGVGSGCGCTGAAYITDMSSVRVKRRRMPHLGSVRLLWREPLLVELRLGTEACSRNRLTPLVLCRLAPLWLRGRHLMSCPTRWLLQLRRYGRLGRREYRLCRLAPLRLEGNRCRGILLSPLRLRRCLGRHKVRLECRLRCATGVVPRGGLRVVVDEVVAGDKVGGQNQSIDSQHQTFNHHTVRCLKRLTSHI